MNRGCLVVAMKFGHDDLARLERLQGKISRDLGRRSGLGRQEEPGNALRIENGDSIVVVIEFEQA